MGHTWKRVRPPGVEALEHDEHGMPRLKTALAAPWRLSRLLVASIWWQQRRAVHR